MPSGTTVRDIGTCITIWCERFTAIFTRLEFPANIVIPDGGGGGGGGDDKPKNCVPLSNQLQLSWTINTTVSKPMVHSLCVGACSLMATCHLGRAVLLSI